MQGLACSAGRVNGDGSAGSRGAGDAPAVAVHGLAQARAALAAAGPRGVLLLSAPGAAGGMGPDWFAALVRAARASHPRVVCTPVLDCGGAPGHVLAALRGGFRLLVLEAGTPGFAALAAVAAAEGARLLPTRPPALDLRSVDLRRPGGQAMLAQWFRATPDDTHATTG